VTKLKESKKDGAQASVPAPMRAKKAPVLPITIVVVLALVVVAVIA